MNTITKGKSVKDFREKVAKHQHLTIEKRAYGYHLRPIKSTNNPYAGLFIERNKK